MPELPAELIRLVSRVTDIPAEELSPGSRFEELDGWSSLTALRLLAGIEDRFAARLDLRAYLAIEDVAGLVALVAATGVEGRSA